jgi:hypothetical protein
MKRIFSLFQQLSEENLILLMTLLSILIAWRIIHIQHGWVNVDSLIYFESARLFSISEWKQGFSVFKWPLYSFLINVVHRLTQLSIQTSAQILDILFFAITTFSFTTLIKIAGGNKLTIICGTFLLLSSSYIVGSILPMLLRDQGFWASFLTSLIFFIQFYRERKLRYAILWQVSAIIAMLFRIEAITFLACLPCLLLFQEEVSLKQRITDFFIINIIPILTILLIIGALITIPSVTLSDFGRLQEAITIFPRLVTDIAQSFTKKADIMGEQVLGYYFADYGLMGVILTLTGIITIKVIHIITWPVIGIYILSYINRCKHSVTLRVCPDTQKIFYATVIIAIVNASVIIAQVFVLSNRYIIPIGFISLIFAAFGLTMLIQAIHTQSLKHFWQKIWFLIILLILTLSLIKNILPKRDGYNYEQEAVAYVKRLNIPIEKIFLVSPRSNYYIEAPYKDRCPDDWICTLSAINNNSIYKYDYLLLNIDIDKNYPEIKKILDSKLPNYLLEKEFYGVNRKKKILFYMKNSAFERMS